jgi:hypothetical protein
MTEQLTSSSSSSSSSDIPPPNVIQPITWLNIYQQQLDRKIPTKPRLTKEQVRDANKAYKEQYKDLFKTNQEIRKENRKIADVKQWKPIFQIPHETFNLKPLNEDASAELAMLIGRKNKGVRFRPVLISKQSAENWLAKKRKQAQSNPKEFERLQKYAIETADLDDDPITPDNVIVYSNKEKNKIKAVDGYEILPPRKKEAKRA